MKFRALHILGLLLGLALLSQSMSCEALDDAMQADKCDKICEHRLNKCEPGTTTETLCVGECNKWSNYCQDVNMECMEKAKTCEDTDWCFDEELASCKAQNGE